MSVPHFAEIFEVLARYGLSASPGSELRRAGSGFSGADVWQVPTTVGPMCLRRWPDEHPTAPELRRIHELLQTVVAAGCRCVPNPLPALDGNTVTLHGGRLWEVTPWMPGTPGDSPRIDDERLDSIWRALASFHLASLSRLHAAPRGPSPGIADRLQKLDHLVTIGLTQLRHAEIVPEWEPLTVRRDEFVRLFNIAVRFVRPMLAAVVADPVQGAMCIRDIRREHILFTGNQVAGWVDFGAAAFDSPAIDAARILGEFCDDRRTEWPALLACYQRTCRGTLLESCPFALIEAFDCSGKLLAPANWFRWILLEARDFVDRPAVLRRIDQLLARLRRLVETV